MAFKYDNDLIGQSVADFVAKHGDKYIVVGMESGDLEFDVWYLKLDGEKIVKCFVQESEEW